MYLKKLYIALLALGAAGFCSGAFAYNFSNSGFYLGAQGGYGSPSHDFSGTSNQEEGGLAGRGYGGFQINQYFGIETGYTFFSNSNYNYTGGAHTQAQTGQWDILGTAGMPFGNSGFRGDLKAGAADVFTKISSNVISGTYSNNDWAPAGGVSASYNVTKNLSFDASYLHVFGNSDNSVYSNNHTDAPSTDLATLGVKYLFTFA